jgi:hypothetical protein
VDQGDQFPRNPFHLIRVPADQGDQFPAISRKSIHLIRVPADQGDQFPGNPFHSQGMNANATRCA